MGIVVVASLAARRWRKHRQQDVHLETDQLGREGRESLVLPFRPAVLHDEVLAFDIAELAHCLQESFQGWLLLAGRPKQITDPVHVRWRLRDGGKRRHAEESESAGDDEPDDDALHSGLLTSVPCRP
jgi:hypothetical protein